MKKTKIKYTFSLLILLFSTALTLFYVKNKNDLNKQTKATYTLADNQKETIQNGDIILRYGYGFVSDNIVRFLNEPYKISHCGIIYKTPGSLNVIHSESSTSQQKEEVYIQNFDDFCKESQPKSIIVLRYKNLTQQKTDLIISVAKEYAKKRIAFDYQFNAEDTTKVFCTELVRNCYQKAIHKNIFIDENQKEDLLQFKILYQSKDFEVILNTQNNQRETRPIQLKKII